MGAIMTKLTFEVTERDFEQLKQICEYVKFHIGLYVATPSALMIIAQGLHIETTSWFIGGTAAMMVIYLISGISAGLFMGKCVNRRWDDSRLSELYIEAYSLQRRIFQHWLYWLGLASGIVGIVVGWLTRACS
jgi:hypothetical protein